MPKIPELQELLENAERMCDAVDDIAGRRHTTFGLLRVELCLFLAHLCKADFHLAEEEAAFIADNLDIPFTTEEMNRYIRTHHTENPDFAKKIPTSFIRLVEYDRAQAVEPSPLSRRSLGEGGAAAYYIAVFQHFGYALISADSVLIPYERRAIADYLSSLGARPSPSHRKRNSTVSPMRGTTLFKPSLTSQTEVYIQRPKKRLLVYASNIAFVLEYSEYHVSV